jgi:hypothetical protein
VDVIDMICLKVIKKITSRSVEKSFPLKKKYCFEQFYITKLVPTDGKSIFGEKRSWGSSSIAGRQWSNFLETHQDIKNLSLLAPTCIHSFPLIKI